MRILLAILFPAYLAAQTPAPAPEPFHIDGRVSSVRGEPLEGVEIALRPVPPDPGAQSKAAAVTNAEGNFALDAPPAFLVAIEVRKTGFITQRIGFAPGQKSRDLLLRLVPEAVIAGRVLDGEGKPIPKASVAAFLYSYSRGARNLIRAGSAQQANDAGEYRIPSLHPGRYYLRVEPKAPGVTTYYPSTLDPFAAVAVDIVLGADRSGIDIRQRIEPVFRVRGKALDASGKPAANASLTILPERPIETGPPTVVASGTDGSFEFKELLAGRYIIRATPNGTDARWAGRSTVVIARGDIDDVEIRVNEGGVLSGTVAMDDDGPLPPVPLIVMLMDAEQRFSKDIDPQVVRDGAFRFEHMVPEKFYLEIGGSRNLYVKSIHAGGLDVTRTPLDLTYGGIDNLRIVLGTKSGTVSITTKPRAGVVLWPDVKDEGNMDSGVRGLLADDKGVVRFQNLRPEKYYVAAFDGVEPAFTQSLEFLDRMRSRATSITLEKGAAIERTLTPISAADAAAVIQMIP